MNELWAAIAARAIDALGIQMNEVVELSEHSGRYDVLLEMVLAIEQRGATPRTEFLPPELISRLLTSTDPAILAHWDYHRTEWTERTERTDRILVLEGEEAAFDSELPAVSVWSQATGRLVQIEERRRLPELVLAVPTEARAAKFGMTLDTLEAALAPALAATPRELRSEIERIRPAIDGANTLVVRTGDNRLQLDVSSREWMHDAGELPRGDARGDIQPVLNLPAGSLYTTVDESATSGDLLLPQAGGASEVTLRFVDGRACTIEARSGAEDLVAMFDRHTGEARRISHLGIGLNPYLTSTFGWPLVDEHRHGALFIAFGENRYLGGENESSLNVDFVIPDASLLADGRPIVDNGTLLV